MCHILADSDSGAGLCGAEMCGLELWRLQACRPTKRLTQEKPSDISLCPQCESLSPALSAPANN
jgi:hypothetical protein